MQRSRRTNPYPLTWEIPLGAIVGVLLLLVLGAQIGRSLANLVTGSGWAFVERSVLFTSLPGLIAGDAAAGLDDMLVVASARLLWVSIALVELALIVACVAIGRWALGRWGPGRIHGMATTSQAAQILGRARLRKHAAVIRPDLHRKHRAGGRA